MTRIIRSRRNRGRHPVPLALLPDPASLAAHIARHLAWLSARGFSPHTVRQRSLCLAAFLAWCNDRAVYKPHELSPLIIDLYQRHVSKIVKKDALPLAPSSQHKKLIAVVVFGRWLVRERLVATNPAADLELPKKGIRLPAAVLTVEEAEIILAVPDVRTPLGLRDRAILEVFYSTGIRRSELARLTVADLDLKAGVLAVRQGKGKKDRFVPIGDRAAAWVAAYLREVRPLLAMHQDEGVLFLSSDGLPIPPETLSTTLNRIVRAADIGKPGACHIFRHTMATLMLEGGADIRYIQQMLGHANLDTTQIYTHVAIHTLKAVHAATHPGASLRSRHEAASETAATSPPHPHLAILLADNTDSDPDWQDLQ